MSHNPNTVKSQHELDNQGMRSSEVLLQAISKAERLQKQLDIAISYLDVIYGLRGGECFNCVEFARRARKKIKELENEIPNQE